MAIRKHLALALLLALGLSACASGEPPQAETPPTRQTQPEAPEPTLEEQQQAAAEEYTEKLTLEQQTAQLFFARCPDTDAAAEAAEYSPGGYILFGRDFDGRTREQVQDGIASCQAAAAVPMLIGADEEGGTVVRVSANPDLRDTRFSSPQKLYAEGGLDRIRRKRTRSCSRSASTSISRRCAIFHPIRRALSTPARSVRMPKRRATISEPLSGR